MFGYELWSLALAIVAGVACGFLNTVASSGSAVSLPVLMAIGLDPITANATNRVPLLLGSISATWKFHTKKALPWGLAIKVSIPTSIGAIVGARLIERGKNRRVADKETGVEGVVRLESLADRRHVCSRQSQFGRLGSHLGRRRLPIDAKQRLTLEARRRQQVAKHLRVEEVIAHQEREALAVELGSRGQHRQTILVMPVLVDAEIQRESFRRAGKRERANTISIESENEVRMSQARTPDRQQRSKQQRCTSDWCEEFGAVRGTSKAIAVAGCENDSSRYSTRMDGRHAVRRATEMPVLQGIAQPFDFAQGKRFCLSGSRRETTASRATR